MRTTARKGAGPRSCCRGVCACRVSLCPEVRGPFRCQYDSPNVPYVYGQNTQTALTFPTDNRAPTFPDRVVRAYSVPSRFYYLPRVCTFSQSIEHLLCGERGVWRLSRNGRRVFYEKASSVLWATTKGQGASGVVCRLTDTIEITTRSCADTASGGVEKKTLLCDPHFGLGRFELPLMRLARMITLPRWGVLKGSCYRDSMLRSITGAASVLL